MRSRAVPIVAGLVLSSLAACRSQGGVPVTEDVLAAEPDFVWRTRNHVRAFYSGHSLSDGVPAVVAQIAAARGQTLDFELQSRGHSLLRERTRGDDASGTAWDGYRTGTNRSGSGLDVAAELVRPSKLPPGQRYDALVVTERHDLPWAAAQEGTATYLADIARRAWQGNPDADVFFYHTWLALDRSAPQPWIDYERRARRLWECVASRANLDVTQSPHRIRVLPGGAALAELVERLWTDTVPGLPAMSPADRVGLLFSDDVHMSAIGTFYMGLLHYAFLFGQQPSGSHHVAELPDETKTFLERLAHQEATDYARIANAGAHRDMEACRAFAASRMCHASTELPARGVRDALKRPYRDWRCRRIYADAAHPANPFRK